MPDAGVYLVMCGRLRVVLDEAHDPQLATDIALAHDQVHHCTPWVQHPLEHLFTPDDPDPPE